MTHNVFSSVDYLIFLVTHSPCRMSVIDTLLMMSLMCIIDTVYHNIRPTFFSRRFLAVEHLAVGAVTDCFQEMPEDSISSVVPFPDPCKAVSIYSLTGVISDTIVLFSYVLTRASYTLIVCVLYVLCAFMYLLVFMILLCLTAFSVSVFSSVK